MESVVPAAEGPSQARTNASVDTVSTGDYTPMRTRQGTTTPELQALTRDVMLGLDKGRERRGLHGAFEALPAVSQALFSAGMRQRAHQKLIDDIHTDDSWRLQRFFAKIVEEGG